MNTMYIDKWILSIRLLLLSIFVLNQLQWNVRKNHNIFAFLHLKAFIWQLAWVKLKNIVINHLVKYSFFILLDSMKYVKANGNMYRDWKWSIAIFKRHDGKESTTAHFDRVPW